jgi:hypothetical protein
MSTENKPKNELAAELLTEYMQVDGEVSRIKAMLDEANRKRSDVVKKVHDALGKGPFTYKGEYLGKIVIRGNTYFFRGKNDEGGVKVD